MPRETEPYTDPYTVNSLVFVGGSDPGDTGYGELLDTAWVMMRGRLETEALLSRIYGSVYGSVCYLYTDPYITVFSWLEALLSRMSLLPNEKVEAKTLIRIDP